MDKKKWSRPEVKTLSAGSAEQGTQNNRQDGQNVNNRS